MILFIAFLLVLIFLLLASIHFYWGFGGKWGKDLAIPARVNNEKVINPGPFECLLVGILLLLVAMFILIRLQMVDFSLPTWLLNYGNLFFASIFILRAIGEFRYVGFFKKIRHTTFGRMDTKYYSPLCLLIGILMIILGLTNCHLIR